MAGFGFDLPFLPDPEYVRFLNQAGDRISSVHFGLMSSATPDARQLTRVEAPETIIQGLNNLSGPKKYLLLNSRFHLGRDYLDPGPLLATLELFLDRGALDGLVLADAYLLRSLSKAGPVICSRLEAVPSVNFIIDSFAKAAVVLDLIQESGFKLPGKIILDRSLNRDLDGLARTSDKIRAAWPGIRIELLANEGCLLHCPFKPAHDSRLGLARTGLEPDHNLSLNRDLGCAALFFERPGLIFKSPFIRPEDMTLYAPFADIVKICGRTRGAAAMKRIASAYLAGEFQGNLLELNDSMEYAAGRIHIENKEIPPDFARIVSGCDKNCRACAYCSGLAERLVGLLPLRLGRMD